MPPLHEVGEPDDGDKKFPLGPSRLVSKAIRRKKYGDQVSQPHFLGRRGTATKLTGTGGTGLHEHTPKTTHKIKQAAKLFPWFNSQCHDLIARRYSSSMPTPSMKNKWGSFISIKTAFNSNDYMTHLHHTPPPSLRIGMNGGSLEQIFIFYAKLQKPGVQRMKKSLTFDEVCQANTTLSYFEFLCAVRDFDIVPNLVTKNDVNSIWKWCKSRRGRRSTPESVIGELEFHDFLEILCCVALVAFQHEDPEEKVKALIQFMRLDDAAYVHNQVSTRGMETSARFNYRSKGETDPFGGDRIREERDRERAALLMSQKRGSMKHPREGDVKFRGWNDDETIRGSRYLGDDTRRIWEETREVVVRAQNDENDRPFDFVREGNGDEYEDDEENYDEDGYFDETFSKSSRKTATSKMTARTNDTAYTSFWSGKSTATKKTLGVDHAELLKKQFVNPLTDLLMPYKFKHASDKKPSWTEFKGPYMDFGVTSRWKKSGYRAVISVVNSGENPILVTPEAYWFDKDGSICWSGDNVEGDENDSDAEVIDVAFEPSVVPPGLRTVISLSLRPSSCNRDEFLGGLNLEISIVPREQGRLAYRHPAGGTEMRKKSSLREKFFVRVPLYSSIVDQKFGDQIGTFKCKEKLEDSRAYKRAGIRMKGAKAKAKEVKQIEDEEDGWA